MASIPLVDLKRQYADIQGEIDAAIRRVLESGVFVGGREVEAFEHEFGAFCGMDGGVGVGNGTDALEIVLRALGVREGDEVITVANTFFATVEAILAVGATPVFVDVDPETMLIDAGQVEPAITSRTRAIVPVHLFGQPCDMGAVGAIAARHDLRVIEDAAQAHGASWGGRAVGSVGDAACFSFYPGKNLGAYGDAGAIVARDASLRERIRMLANHGRREKYTHEAVGRNSRLDPMQAAILRVKLRELAGWNERRACLARSYQTRLADVGLMLPVVRPEASAVWHLFVVRTDRRDDLRRRLKDAGIECGVHYPVPLHKQPALNGFRNRFPLPVTERCAETVLSLPLFPEMTEAELDSVAECIREFQRRS